ncbi:MAG: hypothetical protein HC831_04720, partial [Chloroflexia bacterium]|nr:hypothetical protein [Chloroflexia bacterium]
MKFYGYILVLIVFIVACTKPGEKNNISFLHTQGQDIVNESGERIYLKGVGLGNWLLPEGYMWKFGKD